MSKQRIVWLCGLLFAATWLESCGAMTLEANTPDEPVVAAPRAPRLMRRDGGAKAEDDSDAASNKTQERADGAN